MSKPKKRAIQVDWFLIGRRSAKVIKFIKWPVTLIVALLIVGDYTSFSGIKNIDHDLLLSYISLLRWPFVVLIGFVILRPHLPKLVDRLREAGFGGAKVKFDLPSNQSETTAPSLKNEDDEVDDAATDTKTDEAQDLDAILTSPQAIAAYEQTYRQIHGTQLGALQKLITYIDSGLKTDAFTEDLEEHRRRVGELAGAYNSVPSFMRFMIENILVVYNAKDDTYHITNAGVYFLKYLNDQGILNSYKDY